MKDKIDNFISGLIPYDYALFGGVFVLFLIFLIVAILLRNKVGFSIFLVLIAFGILFIGPTIGYIELHKYLYKNSVKITDKNKLSFTQALVVRGTLTNESKFDFKDCKITAKVFKVTKNRYRNELYKFKPFQKMSIIENNIVKDSKINFKMIIEPFTYSKDFNVSIGAKCR